MSASVQSSQKNVKLCHDKVHLMQNISEIFATWKKSFLKTYNLVLILLRLEFLTNFEFLNQEKVILGDDDDDDDDNDDGFDLTTQRSWKLEASVTAWSLIDTIDGSGIIKIVKDCWGWQK